MLITFVKQQINKVVLDLVLVRATDLVFESQFIFTAFLESSIEE